MPAGRVQLKRAPLGLVVAVAVVVDSLGSVVVLVVVDLSPLGPVDVTDWLFIVCENIWNAASPTASVPFWYAGTSCPAP
jgi:hypothetical protein